MMKDAAPSLRQLVSRLEAQALEIATLRSALDVQFTRIARRQAELDVFATWPRRRWHTLRRPVGRTTIS
jgi:hypothetical protein